MKVSNHKLLLGIAILSVLALVGCNGTTSVTTVEEVAKTAVKITNTSAIENIDLSMFVKDAFT